MNFHWPSFSLGIVTGGVLTFVAIAILCNITEDGLNDLLQRYFSYRKTRKQQRVEVKLRKRLSKLRIKRAVLQARLETNKVAMYDGYLFEQEQRKLEVDNTCKEKLAQANAEITELEGELDI